MNLMNPKDLEKALTRDKFVRELHHLLWIEPQLNRGERDEGWNCRDHALIVAGVAHLLGFRAALCFGHVAFVQGKRGNARPLWLNVSPHAWVGVERCGHYDLSVRLRDFDGFGPDWSGWNVDGLVADRYVPPGRVRVAWTYRPQEYNEAIDKAGALGAGKTTIYGCETIVELTAREVRDGLDTCNSLLTDWLRAEFGGKQDLHASAMLHLVELLRGEGTSLASLSRADAWRALAARPGDAVREVCSRGRLA